MSAETMVSLRIDGRNISAPKGTAVLDAAKLLGIHIPTLCHHEALTRQATCRICIVELSIEKRGRTHQWMDASCVYPIEEGLVVLTNSPRVRAQRKILLELMLSRAPEAPVLLELAKEYGAEPGRFESIDKGKSNCILCGLCVRACSERINAGGLGFAFRGVRKKLVSPLHIAKDVCIGCTACGFVCPTNAIKIEQERSCMHMVSLKTDLPLRQCSRCGAPIASVRQHEQVRETLALSDSVLELCPDCRRKQSLTSQIH
jgi:NADH dehydrogenase/NADH:ubiquinone oxidoreductase subunit G